MLWHASVDHVAEQGRNNWRDRDAGRVYNLLQVLRTQTMRESIVNEEAHGDQQVHERWRAAGTTAASHGRAARLRARTTEATEGAGDRPRRRYVVGGKVVAGLGAAPLHETLVLSPKSSTGMLGWSC